MNKQSQNEKILAVLFKRDASPLDFNQLPPHGLGIANYRARISELRKDGWNISPYAKKINGKIRHFYTLPRTTLGFEQLVNLTRIAREVEDRIDRERKANANNVTSARTQASNLFDASKQEEDDLPLFAGQNAVR